MNLTEYVNASIELRRSKQRDYTIVYIYSITVSIIVFAGTIGNILSFLLFSMRHRLRSQPVSIYICGLAVVDTILLWLVYARNCFLVLFKHGFPIFGTMCNVFWFSSSTFMSASAWINVVMTFDRIVAVFLPLHYKVILNNSVLTRVDQI